MSEENRTKALSLDITSKWGAPPPIPCPPPPTFGPLPPLPPLPPLLESPPASPTKRRHRTRLSKSKSKKLKAPAETSSSTIAALLSPRDISSCKPDRHTSESVLFTPRADTPSSSPVTFSTAFPGIRLRTLPEMETPPPVPPREPSSTSTEQKGILSRILGSEPRDNHHQQQPQSFSLQNIVPRSSLFGFFSSSSSSSHLASSTSSSHLASSSSSSHLASSTSSSHLASSTSASHLASSSPSTTTSTSTSTSSSSSAAAFSSSGVSTSSSSPSSSSSSSPTSSSSSPITSSTSGLIPQLAVATSPAQSSSPSSLSTSISPTDQSRQLEDRSLRPPPDFCISVEIEGFPNALHLFPVRPAIRSLADLIRVLHYQFIRTSSSSSSPPLLFSAVSTGSSPTSGSPPNDPPTHEWKLWLPDEHAKGWIEAGSLSDLMGSARVVFSRASPSIEFQRKKVNWQENTSSCTTELPSQLRQRARNERLRTQSSIGRPNHSSTRPRSNSDQTNSRSFFILPDDPSSFVRNTRKRLDSHGHSDSSLQLASALFEPSDDTLDFVFLDEDKSSQMTTQAFDEEDATSGIEDEESSEKLRKNSTSSSGSNSNSNNNSSSYKGIRPLPISPATNNSFNIGSFKPSSNSQRLFSTPPPGLGFSPTNPPIFPRTRPRANMMTSDELPGELSFSEASLSHRKGSPLAAAAFLHASSPAASSRLRETASGSTVSGAGVEHRTPPPSARPGELFQKLELPQVKRLPKMTLMRKLAAPRPPLGPSLSTSILFEFEDEGDSRGSVDSVHGLTKSASTNTWSQQAKRLSRGLDTNSTTSGSAWGESDVDTADTDESDGEVHVDAGEEATAAAESGVLVERLLALVFKGEQGDDAALERHPVVDGFFRAATLHISTAELFHELSHAYSQAEEKGQMKTLSDVLALLKCWLGVSYSEDLVNTPTMERILEFLHDHLPPPLLTQARWSMRCNAESFEFLRPRAAEDTPNSPRTSGSSSSSSSTSSQAKRTLKASLRALSTPRLHIESILLETDPVVLCDELTAVEKQRLNALPRAELLNAAWEKTSTDSLTRTTIRSWNDFTSWLQFQVVSVVALKERAEIIKHLILTMNACLENGNYISTMGILSALDRPAISRLRRTWAMIPPKYAMIKSYVSDIMSPLANHQKYRAHLDQRLQQNKPVIPLMGLVFRDISVILQLNPSEVNGSVNLEKIVLVGKVLKLVETAQRRPYFHGHMHSTDHAQRIRTWLANAPSATVKDDEEFQNILYNSSLLCEPKANSVMV